MDVPVYDVQVVRDLNDLTLFDDLFTTPNYTGATLDEIGYVLHFDGDLTAQQQDWVVDRISHTPEQETIIRQARAALVDLRAIVNFSGTPTLAGLQSAVKTCARANIGLIQLELEDMNA